MVDRKKREPVHTIFYLCSTYTPDEAWADFFRECSFGKFPRGIRFEDNAIKCMRKKQVFTEHLPKDPEKAFETILTVFRDRLGIKTAREKKSAALKFDRQQEASVIQTWKDATTAASRLALVRNYIDRMASVYSLSDSERRQIITLIEVCIANKILDGERIKVQTGKIMEIEGLCFDPYTRKASIRGQFKQPPLVHIPVPIDYQPIVQSNHPKDYLNILTYHGSKMEALKG
jgi:hypothetical protein